MESLLQKHYYFWFYQYIIIIQISFTFSIKFSYTLADVELVNTYSLMNPKAHSFFLQKNELPSENLLIAVKEVYEKQERNAIWQNIWLSAAYHYVLADLGGMLSWKEL